MTKDQYKETRYVLNQSNFWLLLCFVFISVFSSSSQVITEKDHVFILNGKEAFFLLDPDMSYSSVDVPLEKFERSSFETLNFGFLKGAVWVLFKVESDLEREMIFEIQNPVMDFAQVYEKRNGEFEMVSIFGDRLPFRQRPIDHRFFQTMVKVPNEFLIRFENNADQLFTPILFLDNKGLIERDEVGQLLWGFYFGVLILIFFFVLIIYLFQRQKGLLYYLSYLLSMMALQLVFSGLGNQFFFQNYPVLVNKFPMAFGVMSMLFLTVFIQVFLKTKKNSPKLNSVLTFMKYILVGAFVILPFEGLMTYSAKVLNILGIGIMLLLLLVSVQAIRKGFKPAYYLVVSFSVFVIAVIIFVSRSFGLVPTNIITEYALQFGSCFEAGFLAIAIIREFKSRKDQNTTLAKRIKQLQLGQTVQLELKVVKRSKEIEEQNLQLVEVNRKIIESIDYASKIQKSIIPGEKEFLSDFTGGFVLYEPKDIVSGDFYWKANVRETKSTGEEDVVLFTLGDCTGHGVPGALLSIVALRMLNNSLFEKKIQSALTTLEYVDMEFNNLFQISNENTNFNEGVELVICAYNPKSLILQFAGANIGLVLMRGDEMIQYRGVKKAIGWVLTEENYIQEELQLEVGDRLYFTSDGFVDQFGGEFNKKIKRKNYLKLITEIQHLNMSEQKVIVKDYFEQWKGTEEQTDDVCVVGIEI